MQDLPPSGRAGGLQEACRAAPAPGRARLGRHPRLLHARGLSLRRNPTDQRHSAGGVGAWAAHTNRRWVVTTAAVFGAIEFYTQWFERLGAEPWAIIVAGLTIVAFAIALWRSPPEAKKPGSIPCAHCTLFGGLKAHEPPT
jgi:hypothetical protein